MKTDTFWKNKRVFITGGTSGLGRALVQQLDALGAKTATVARREAPGAIQGDVGDKWQIHRIYNEALAQLGQVDVLINNASTLGVTPLKLLLDTECEDLSQVLETNLLGPFRLIKLVAGGMLLNGFGVVVNISSDAAVSAYPRWGSYGVSKAALDHLTRILQAELEGQGIRFVALDPGDMNTPLHLAAIPEADISQLHKPEESAKLLLEQIAHEKFSPVRRSLR
jgi:NAD(P)-dependent dehydrogenase (short-subunit alcohol dehydrogenase family)